VRSYLGHIAAKVTGASPVVRPRVPSLFEPVKGTQSLGIPNLVTERNVAASAKEPGGLEQDRSVEAVSRPAARASQEPSVPSTSDAAAEPVTHVERMHIENPRRDMARSEERPLSWRTRPATERTRREEEVQRAETSSPRVSTRPQEIPVMGEPERQRRDEQPSRIEPQGLFGRERTNRVEMERVEREVVRMVLGRDEGEAAHERIRPAMDRDEKRREPVVVSPVVSANQPAANERTAPVRESAREVSPAVQVTIGRLIVEAVMPSSAPAPLPVRQSPRPQLSLDDYLRQRGGRA